MYREYQNVAQRLFYNVKKLTLSFKPPKNHFRALKNRQNKYEKWQCYFPENEKC